MELGEHTCALYDNDADRRAVVGRVLRDGLQRNMKILYVADGAAIDQIRGWFGLSEEEHAGRVTFGQADDCYGKGGRFDPDCMIDHVNCEIKKAEAEGFAGLLATGEMSWALRGIPGSERLMEYEAKLNRVYPGSRGAGLCQYDMRLFPPARSLDVLRAHPKAVVGRQTYDNLYYLPPEEMLSDRREEAELQRWIGNLATRHELLERLRARSAQLEAANRELEEFAHSASHDLKSPLRAINAYSGLLAKHLAATLDHEGRTLLDAIGGATRRMEAVVGALLALGGIGQRELRRERVDLSALARAVVEELRQGEPGRAVEARIQDGLFEDADPVLARIILQNLIGNAWKFTGERADAVLEFGRLPGTVDYFVRDNGAGFDPAFAANLFKPFRRLHAGSRFPGSGVGLATVHRAVARHEGEVWAESEPEKGATFWFRLRP